MSHSSTPLLAKKANLFKKDTKITFFGLCVPIPVLQNTLLSAQKWSWSTVP